MNKFTRKFFLITLIFLLTGCQSVSPALSANTTYALSLISNDSSPPDAQAAESSDIRSLDGTGNNLAHPNWGSAEQQYLRFSQAAYADGASSPSGADRPSARAVSNAFSTGPDDEEGIPNDRDFSAFVYAWGQFIDHDINLTDTASPKESFPISVPSGDAWFDPTSTGTMTIPISRSVYDPATGVNSPREQINSITAFIDGSQVYGVDAARNAALREFSGGRLKTSTGNLLSFNTAGFPNFNDAHIVDDAKLFLAGDVRANENPDLLSLQTLFVREHNRLAAEIASRNPTWNDEQIYQQARRIVIAEIQKITYEDFLPALLGQRALAPYQGYKSNVNPGIATEFSTAAFRFGHSMVGNDIEFIDNDGEEIHDALLFRDAFFNPNVVIDNGIDPILKYLASDDAQEVDTIVVNDLRNFLFGQPGQGGFDLAAMNVQRGRDHGLADYNTVRVAYGLPRVTSFDQITSDKALQTKLASTYGSVDKIDLWIGGLAEDHLPNSSVGVTFTRIIADQFTRLRDGDRFWYQNALPGNVLRDIERTSLADVIRRNTSLTKLQDNVFFFNEETTVIVDSAAAPVAPTAAPPTGDTESEEDENYPENQPPDRRRPGTRPPGGRRPPPPDGRPPRRP